VTGQPDLQTCTTVSKENAMKRIYLAVVTAIGLLALAACGSSGSSAQGGGGSPTQTFNTSTSGQSPSAAGGLPTDPGSVTIGSADFPESILLADIYGDAMAAKGVKVSKHLNIGERAVYMKALSNGEITAIPEYTGSILPFLLGKTTTAKTPDDVYAQLQQVAAANKFAVTNFAAAQDSDTITVTQGTASKYHLKSIADLKSVAGNLTLGAPANFKSRPDGVPALKSIYGVSFGQFVATDAGGTATVNALINGHIDAADVFSTDPSIVKNHFVSLADPKSMFAAQNIVPIFAKSTLTQPMKDACDAVSAKLDTKTLLTLDSKLGTNTDPDTVAKAWLKQEGLG
jgi:osmoprotectant transport system substrate-binding protein